MSIHSLLFFLTLLFIVKQHYDPTTITTTGSSSSSSALVVFAAAAAHQDNGPPRRRSRARPVHRLHFLAFQPQPQPPQRITRIITTAAAAAVRTNTGAKQREITCISLTRGGDDDSSTITTRKIDKKQQQEPQHQSNINKKTSNRNNRRNFFEQIILLTSSTTFFGWTTTNNIPVPIPIIPPALAYEPDPDPLCESLYLISRVQEATVQQERFVRKATSAQELQNKMKLTLLLIEKNYKLVDQIIYCSTFIPSEHLVEATEAGNIAAQELQSAIDYVRNDLTFISSSSSSSATMTTAITLDSKQKQYLIDALTTTREQLCIFLDLLPQDKLEVARARIERENQLNMQEFDGDENAGVYNPVVLPWKKNTHTSS